MYLKNLKTRIASIFPHSKCNGGSRPSYGWRSIRESQNLLKFGLKREIGNNSEIDIWREAWIVDSDAQPRAPKPLPHVDIEDWSMGDLKEVDSDQWNLSTISTLFLQEDVPRVLQIKPGGLYSGHGYSWTRTNSGIYSVKSSYNLWASSQLHGYDLAPEPAPNYSAIFRCIWAHQTSPKLRNFLWRCVTLSLSVGSEMKKRNLHCNTGCSLCSATEEDVVHVFFLCPYARLMWALSPFASVINDSCISIQGKIWSCLQLEESLTEEYKYLWPWIIWRIWKIRNGKVFQGLQPDPQTAYNLALSDSVEWKEHRKLITKVTLMDDLPVQQPWQPPPLNVLKCNTDATWQDSHDRCGVAWILRDSQGRVIFWGIKTFPKLLSPLDAEATSLVWAVNCIGNMGYKQVIFEMDSTSLLNAIHQPRQWPRLLTYTNEIHHRMAANGTNFEFKQEGRNGNKAADCLAKYAKDLSIYFGSIDNRIPLWLRPFLDELS